MIGYSKKIEKIIQENAFDEKKKKPRLKFNYKYKSKRSHKNIELFRYQTCLKQKNMNKFWMEPDHTQKRQESLKATGNAWVTAVD